MNRVNRLILICITLLCFSGSGAAENKAEGAFLGGRETVYPDWFKESFLDLREDIREAAAEGRRVMIFFHQRGCPYCNLMVERNLSQKAIREAMQANLDVITLNMWGDREVTGLDGAEYTEKDFARALRVQFTPTLLAFDEAGRVILRLNGYIPPHNFKVALDYVIQHKEKAYSYREYLAAHRPAQPMGALNAEPFFKKPPYDLRRDGGRLLAVFFEQLQCPACDLVHREVLVDPEVRAQIERFDVVQLDMWSSEPLVTPDGRNITARAWANELGVAFAPTVVLFNTAGEEVIRSEAYFKRFHTASIFDYVASGGYRDEPSFQRYISQRSEHIRAQGKDVDIWK